MTPGTVIKPGELDRRQIGPLDPSQDDEAAAILAAATWEGTGSAGAAALAAARHDHDTVVRGATVDGELVAVYALRLAGASAELALLAVAPPHRRHGHGRACLTDALRRAGRRPLVVETDDDALAFYTAAGFKLIGKRRHPSGTVRYRLGWHAPRPAPATSDGLDLRGEKRPTLLRGSASGDEGTS